MSRREPGKSVNDPEQSAENNTTSEAEGFQISARPLVGTSSDRPSPESGTGNGLPASYGADLVAVVKKAAALIDRILRGATPRDIPIEQANEYEFVLNLRTARALELNVPLIIRLQATRVID